MNRIKIDFPSKPVFTTTLQIRITDINYGGHVGNDSILSMIHEIRVRYLNSLGYKEMDLEGVGLIMRDVAIEFRKEIFYGESIIAAVGISSLSKIGFELVYHLFRKDIREADQTIVLARTGMICYDYKNKKIVAIPEKAVGKLSAGLEPVS